ncbi:MAG: NAD(P)H-hydrate dehydratase [Luteimonas sp.]
MSAAPPRLSASLYGRAALRALEAAATARLDGDGFALMARAGQAGWRELLRRWPQAQRIVVACGPGNNGGDGYVLALHALEAGRKVSVLRLDGHAPRGDLARRACDAWVEAGGRIDVFEGRFPEADAIVDALFGISLSRAPDADVADLVEAINAAGTPVLALDAPSGVDTDTGAVPGAAVRADATVQFIAAHAGLATGAALDHVGELALAGLELPADLFRGVEPVAACLRSDDLQGRFAPRSRGAHKGDSGFLLCIGGDAGTGGAVLLAAEAALRCGAGLVGVATHPAHVAAALARRPEVMARAVDGAGALRPLLERAGMVAIGPGLGQSAWGSALFGVALAAGRPLVLDADALNLLAKGGSAQKLARDAILTPHPGEAARLLGVSTAQVQAGRYAAARQLCERFGCVVVLKGAGSVVAAPGALPQVVAAGNPGMASGGTGDVLTGVIAALRAQGREAFDAAATGALLHAVAGDVAAGEGGERGMLASDLFAPLRALVNA